MKSLRTKIEIAVLFGLIFSVVFSFFSFNNDCDELRRNILRFHIIANSDDAADQSIKLAVRDAVLFATQNEFKSCKNIDDAVAVAKSQTELINDTAIDVIEENGYDYSAKTLIKKEYFATRVYDDYTLPAGVYNTVTVTLGEGNGHNWWCIVFPSVCVPASSDTNFDKNISENGQKIVSGGGKYIIKFKMAELYERLKYDIMQKNQKK